jgi:AmmeMemoRadiSam system protein B
MGLDIRPSSDPHHPGLLLRDHYRYSDAWIVLPPILTEVLRFFDGAHTAEDLEFELRRLTGQADGSAAQQLIEALDRSGFLENLTFSQLRESRHRAFAESPVRSAVHAGSGYPNEADALRAFIQGYLEGPAPAVQPGALGVAAPHVSPSGARQSYGAAYRGLTPDLRDRTFVILGTSHYGQANRFGLTRKPFETPLGTTRTDPALLNELAEQPAVVMEDYCHVIEHSIEFQVLFLQYLYGADVKILPLLCGSFGPSIFSGGRPEDDDTVRRFFGTLGAIAARDADRLFWVMGVDMAHIGIRYGDSVAALAERDQMLRVRERDRDRISSLNAGDPEAFWDKVSENQDDLRWCGSSPLYTFMRVLPAARGTLQSYEQWNIDAESVVSFAGISFAKA